MDIPVTFYGVGNADTTWRWSKFLEQDGCRMYVCGPLKTHECMKSISRETPVSWRLPVEEISTHCGASSGFILWQEDTTRGEYRIQAVGFEVIRGVRFTEGQEEDVVLEAKKPKDISEGEHLIIPVDGDAQQRLSRFREFLEGFEEDVRLLVMRVIQDSSAALPHGEAETETTGKHGVVKDVTPNNSVQPLTVIPTTIDPRSDDVHGLLGLTNLFMNVSFFEILKWGAFAVVFLALFFVYRNIDSIMAAFPGWFPLDSTGSTMAPISDGADRTAGQTGNGETGGPPDLKLAQSNAMTGQFERLRTAWCGGQGESSPVCSLSKSNELLDIRSYSLIAIEVLLEVNGTGVSDYRSEQDLDGIANVLDRELPDIADKLDDSDKQLASKLLCLVKADPGEMGNSCDIGPIDQFAQKISALVGHLTPPPVGT